MDNTMFQAGLLLNGAVSGIVGMTAAALVAFLWSRWSTLDGAQRAYTCFWMTTAGVWLIISARHFVLSANPASSSSHILGLLTQAFVFLSGPPLLYYLTIRLARNTQGAAILATLSFICGGVAFWYMVQPQGLIALPATFFSAETILNPTSLKIFNIEAALIVVLLLIDLAVQFRHWHHHGTRLFYEILYPIPVLLYLGLGIVEQSNLVLDWVTIVFHVFYTAAFLSVYILMTEHESAQKTFLISETEARALSRYS